MYAIRSYYACHRSYPGFLRLARCAGDAVSSCNRQKKREAAASLPDSLVVWSVLFRLRVETEFDVAAGRIFDDAQLARARHARRHARTRVLLDPLGPIGPPGARALSYNFV